jgi:Ternary complex associated domain 9
MVLAKLLNQLPWKHLRDRRHAHQLLMCAASPIAMEVIIPDEFEFIVDRSFIESALSKWGMDLKMTVLRGLVGGRTSASVLLVDIRATFTPGSRSSDSKILGQFVLKIDEKKVWEKSEPNELARHAAATAWNPAFAKQHIPTLIRDYDDEQKIALLYEIAGFKSRVNLVTIDGLDVGSLERRCYQLSYSLFRDWNQNYRIETNIPPRNSIQEWLGYRLDPNLAPDLHAFVQKHTGGQPIFIIGKRALMNPLWLCNSECLIDNDNATRFVGRLHGDLHPDNFLFDRRYPESQLFWLIDFALSREGPLGYDHAYLELSLLLRELVGKDPERLLSILDALDALPGSDDAATVPPEHLGMTTCLRAIRAGGDEWQKACEPNSPDPFIAQQLLSRVAVSVNWANKPIDDSQRRLALAYGAWAANKYLSDFHTGVRENLFKALELAGGTSIELDNLSHSDLTLPNSKWNEFWQELDGFDEALSKFILVTDRLRSDSDLASLGFLPWSAIIDLDPESDITGLHLNAAPILEKIRSVTWFGTQGHPVNFDRGTAWMMAAGWPSRGEPVPTSLSAWRRAYLRGVRELSASIHRASSPQPVKVVVFLNEPGATIEMVKRLLEDMDEELLDQTAFIIISKTDQTGSGIRVDKCLIVDPSEIITRISKMYCGRGQVQKTESDRRRRHHGDAELQLSTHSHFTVESWILTTRPFPATLANSMLHTIAAANLLQAPKGRWMAAPVRVVFANNHVAYRRRQGSV